MMSLDLPTILENISQSLLPVASLLAGMGYISGLLLMVAGIVKLKHIGQKGHSSEGLSVAMAFIGGGALLLFLPSSISVLSNTFFGATNILSYSNYNGDVFQQSMKTLIKVTGLIWFVRGAYLLIHSSKPGDKEGPKGLAFLFAGVCAMNFDNMVTVLDYALTNLFSTVNSFKRK